jgi:two-component system, NtrC family, nitrogen regulation sensor histidine kinase GlnL
VTGMAAMLAHEIRNPLAGITGAAQLLEMSLSDSERELTGLIQEEAARIGKLVDRVEQFGDLRPAQRQALNIHDVIDRARRSAAAGFAAHARFTEEFDPSLPPTSGDPDQLLQVFQNLLKNAGEAIPKVGGVIGISTAYRPGVRVTSPGGRSESLPLLVTVTDNGPGIPETLIRDIFDPFVSSKANGSGLGLSLVSKFISDHGGAIECDSRPGRTRFQIRLPVWKGEESESEA